MMLDAYRADFEHKTNRSVSMPIAGATVWFVVALVSTLTSEKMGILILLFASGTIFPLAVLVARLRGENLTDASNPLNKLMGLCVLMVNLLWAVHIPLFIYAPEFVPLSVGIGLGLHWIVYSWIVKHPVGIIHAIARTLLVVTVWLSFADHRLLGVGLAIVVVYCISIYQMLTRTISEQPKPLQPSTVS